MTYTELLLDLLYFSGGKEELIVANRTHTEFDFHTYKLALRLRERKALTVRAIVENWSRDRLIREIY